MKRPMSAPVSTCRCTQVTHCSCCTRGSVATPGSPGYLADFKFEYSQDKAKAALAKSGFSPEKPAKIKFFKQFHYPWEQGCVMAQPLFVEIEEFRPHQVIACIAWLDIEPEAEQAARAGRGFGADVLKRQGRKAASNTLPVEGISQIGRGIREGPVEVEENGFDHNLVMGGNRGVACPRFARHRDVAADQRNGGADLAFIGCYRMP